MEFIQIITLIGVIILIAETTLSLIINSSDKLKAGNRRKVYVDTSALMDGRILNVAEAKFLGDDLIIPRSVIRELQLLADGRDNDRRNRARFGLDIANSLQRVEGLHVEILQDELGKGVLVDERLLELAKKNHGMIFTTDFNLNKVAATEGIEVLNVNELAVVLKNEYLPGEHFRIKITGTGNNPGQGVGHMQDGTMVVVDNAATRVNSEVDIDVLRFIQTSAGRMVFAKVSAHQTKKKKK